MNRAYKLVWNAVSNSWTVASELAKNGKKSSGKCLRLAVLLAAGFTTGVAVAAPAVDALPSGEAIANGTATFDRSVANQLTINQSSNKLITNWNSFDVGSNGKVIFNQPDATAAALNRVSSGSATEIFGQVTANGQLVIVNPSGITFGAGSQVSAAAITASVMDANDAGFNAGLLSYVRGASTATIDNQGSLTATAGNVYLFAPTIKNSGSISATGGDVRLMNADSVNIIPPLGFSSGASTISGLIQQSGSITATQVSGAGGKIYLTGDTSQSNSQIQLAGTLDATTNTTVNGRSIVVNGDVNLNGTANALAFTSTDGYSLTNGAALNLNGASSGFSVNGTAYTVIRDVNQLQAMNSNLSGKYVLANNIDASDTVNWNSGTGFAPVGNVASKFTGVLDGLGHTLSNLYINRPDIQNGTGLLGMIQNAKISNIGLLGGSITGQGGVGSLVGFANSGNTLYRVYSTATVNGVESVGGIIGVLGSNNDNLSYAYFSGNVSSEGTVGGLVGDAGFSGISYGYVTGTVTGSQNPSLVNYTGGLAGYSEGTIQNSYASGLVTGLYAGGLFGYIAGTYSNNYWDMTATGQNSAYSGGVNIPAIGLNSAQFKQLASFSNWGNTIDAQGGTGAAWRIYDGQTGPLLRTFLKPLTASGNGSKTYDGIAVSIGNYTLSDASADTSKLLGTAQVGGTLLGARNAGTYTQTVSGLYSGQDGYDLNFVDGQFVINKAALSISTADVIKTYDGTTSAKGSVVINSGSLYGSDSISGGSFAFADKNAGTGKTVTVSGVTVNDGNNGGNYEVTYVDNITSTINKRQLILTAVADSKEYDGKLTATVNAKPVVVGRQRGDSIVGLTQSFANKNAGTGKAINVDAGYAIRDGNGGNNYDVVIVNSTAGVITPKAITISTVANTKVYDGGITSAKKPLVTGLLGGDRVTGLFQQYDSKTVGTGKKLLVKAGYVVQDGNGGNNYAVTEQGSTDGVITAN
jgi:filamentous hemagglutinin family protein